MAVTVTQFRVRYRAFSSTNEALIAACLAEAELEVYRPVWGTRADAGVMALAAHKIAMDAMGEKAKLKSQGRTDYLATYERLRGLVAAGPRLV